MFSPSEIEHLALLTDCRAATVELILNKAVEVGLVVRVEKEEE